MIIGFLIFLIVIGAAIWFLTFAINKFKESAQSSSKLGASETTKIVSQGDFESSGGAEADSGSSAESTSAGGSEAASGVAAAGPDDTDSPSGSGPTDGAEPVDPAVSQGERVSPGGTTMPEIEPAQWPYLQIRGVVGKGLRGAATINGKVISVGESIENVEVVAIGDYGVKLEFKNETRFAKAGSVIQ